MKLLLRIGNYLLVFVVALTLISAIGTAIKKEPILLSVIRSNSMYPVWERGDMVVIENTTNTEQIKIGDIIFFKAEKGGLSSKGWVAHRVIGGNEESGYITQGDANPEADQSEEDVGPIQREWIAGRAFTIGDNPIIIPKIGFLSLWLEEYQTNPYLLPSIAVLLAVIIAISEIKSSSRKRKRKEKKGIDRQLIYILTGVTMSVVIAATMISTSQKLNIIYEVTEGSKGVLMGSTVGILQVGDEVTRPLTTLSNGGKFKLIGTITTNDKQIQLSHSKIIVSPKEKAETTFTVNAIKPGKYDSSISVGLFYPFLPSSIIYYLASVNYWLALAVVSLIPGLPFMIYPLFDEKMRRGIIASLRKRRNKLISKMPL